MLKLLCFFIMIPIILCSNSNVLLDLINHEYVVELYKDGEEIVLDDENRDKIIEIFFKSLEGSVQMPALAVSIHEETLKQMKKGFWLKFNFDNTMINSEMPFDCLLIQIVKDCCGIDVIRGLNNKFEGRCFYIDMKNDLNELYDLIDNIKSIKNVNEIELDFEQHDSDDYVVDYKKLKDDEKDNKNKVK